MASSGVLIVDPTPLRVTDVRKHPVSYGFPFHHPGMRAFLGTPILVRGEVFGNLHLCDKRDAAAFTDTDEELSPRSCQVPASRSKTPDFTLASRSLRCSKIESARSLLPG